MSTLINRRDAMKAMMGTGIASNVALAMVDNAHADGEVTKEWNTGSRDGFGPMVMKIYDISNDYRRQDVLGSALYELHTTFRLQDVYNNAYTLRVNQRGDTPVEYVYDEYWPKTNLENHPQAGFNTPKMLLWNQFFCMKAADPFPTIHVKPFFEK